MKASVLSTRKLTAPQRELLLNAGIGLVEADFISVVPLDFNITELPENIIFTSKNAVEVVLASEIGKLLKEKRIFCVGEKTAALLEKNGFRVSETAHYGADLAETINRKYSAEEFLFFCGKKRRPELPNFLKKNNISLTEVYVYNTKLTPKKIERNFNGLLFLSPSAIKSFCSLNEISETTAFCIGKTTASEAEKHTQNIVLGSKPTIESLIVQVIKYYS